MLVETQFAPKVSKTPFFQQERVTAGSSGRREISFPGLLVVPHKIPFSGQRHEPALKDLDIVQKTLLIQPAHRGGRAEAKEFLPGPGTESEEQNSAVERYLSSPQLALVSPAHFQINVFVSIPARKNHQHLAQHPEPYNRRSGPE